MLKRKLRPVVEPQIQEEQGNFCTSLRNGGSGLYPLVSDGDSLGVCPCGPHFVDLEKVYYESSWGFLCGNTVGNMEFLALCYRPSGLVLSGIKSSVFSVGCPQTVSDPALFFMDRRHSHGQECVRLGRLRFTSFCR